jgi:hypothetical protein
MHSLWITARSLRRSGMSGLLASLVLIGVALGLALTGGALAALTINVMYRWQNGRL